MPKDWSWEASPCLSCHRRENPDECRSKVCWYWYDWFIRSWEQARELIREHLKEEDENG